MNVSRSPIAVWGRYARTGLSNSILILVLLAVLIFAPAPGFLTASNLIAILATTALVGVLAVMSTGVVIGGGFDLSVGSVVALSGLIAAELLSVLGPDAWLMAILGALACGAIIGAVNGAIVTRLPVPPLIATLGTLYVVRGAATWFGGSAVKPITGPPEILFLGQGLIGPIPVQAVLFVLFAAILTAVERRTTYGRRVFAVGSNDVAATLARLPVKRTRFTTYVLSGLGAGLAGIIVSSQIQAAAAYYGQGLELDVVTAILIGGTSIAGGEGSATKSALGALFVGVVLNGMGVLNVSPDLQLVVRGVLIVVAVLFVQRVALVSWSEAGHRRSIPAA